MTAATAAAGHVPDRIGDRERLPQRPGWDRRRRYFVRREPYAVDAFRFHCHADRRRDYRNNDADIAVQAWVGRRRSAYGKRTLLRSANPAYSADEILPNMRGHRPGINEGAMIFRRVNATTL